MEIDARSVGLLVGCMKNGDDQLLTGLAEMIRSCAEGSQFATELTAIAARLDICAPKCRHNARGAGREKNSQPMIDQYLRFGKYMNSGASAAEIMRKMDISKSTYYRLKKAYEEDRASESFIIQCAVKPLPLGMGI